EAFEKRSRVRVRVMAQTIRDLITEADNVIIVGHKNADFDCVGSAMCMSAIVRSYHKECALVFKSGGIEDKLSRTMSLYEKELAQRHIIVSEEEALETLDDNTLVICVDHHILSQCNAPQIVSNAKKVVVVDHHRRGMDLLPNTILLYIESSASSTCELTCELMNYQQTFVDINELEATIMLTGIMIDTNRFRVHTGTRTFEAAANLKRLGANVQESDEMLKDTFEDFELKQSAMTNLQLLESGVVISAMDEKRKVNRAILSQVAEYILSVKDVEAAFVLGNTIDGKVSISARSNGNVNCQVLMEVFHGGGHFSAAAAQIENATIKEVNDKLKEAIHKYFSEEGINNESDFT
ncbi:MAG: DHH family phosphoesterase, partial [Erysipelotrichales bacterium]|nr:DHH family phosphoesterase [Erysipelotrichales bacterium]